MSQIQYADTPVKIAKKPLRPENDPTKMPRGLIKVGVTPDGMVFNKDELSPISKARCGFIRKPEERSWKQKMVTKILIRWWYCMEPWPPVDMNYEELLRNAGYREVPIATWPEEEEIEIFKGDIKLRKAYQMIQFPGVFRDSEGRYMDFRSHDSAPSYNNLITKSDDELQRMLICALQNQLKDLDNSVYNEDKLREDLERELASAQAARGAIDPSLATFSGGSRTERLKEAKARRAAEDVSKSKKSKVGGSDESEDDVPLLAKDNMDSDDEPLV